MYMRTCIERCIERCIYACVRTVGCDCAAKMYATCMATRMATRMSTHVYACVHMPGRYDAHAATAEHTALARKLAARSIVLLKNELPPRDRACAALPALPLAAHLGQSKIQAAEGSRFKPAQAGDGSRFKLAVVGSACAARHDIEVSTCMHAYMHPYGTTSR